MLCAPLDWQYAELPSSASDAVLCSVLVPIMKSSCYSLRLNQQSLTSELNASNQHFSLPALPIGTNLILIYKILLQFKILNEPYLDLFVQSQ